MKTIGMLGGMSWQSTVSYYQVLNQGIEQALGGLHSAKIILNSVDFSEIEKLQHQSDWEQLAKNLTNAACSVEAAGADFLVICTNTMHKVAPQIEQKLSIPILHIADATGDQLRVNNVHCVGLLGTRFTMAQDFYKGRLMDNYAIDVLVPDEDQQTIVHDIIYQELCAGEILPSSRRHYLEIISSLTARGAEAIILGCTEIGLLVQQQHTEAPLYDTTTIHAAAAVSLALEK